MTLNAHDILDQAYSAEHPRMMMSLALVGIGAAILELRDDLRHAIRDVSQ